MCVAPPQISEAFFSLGLEEVLIGEMAQLQCTAFGVPAPNISWGAEGTVLINGGRINITVVRDSGNSVSSTLTLSNVTLSDDGPFTCAADNGVLPTATSTLNLIVLCKSSLQALSVTCKCICMCYCIFFENCLQFLLQ